MANSVATLKLALTYAAPGGQSVTVPQQTINAAFQASSVGFVDIPDATAGDTEIPVPMGSIGTGATLCILKNNSGQDLKVEINGAAAPSHDLPAGGFTVIAMADLPTARKLTAISVATTGVQAGAGSVEYFLFGDPE